MRWQLLLLPPRLLLQQLLAVPLQPLVGPHPKALRSCAPFAEIPQLANTTAFERAKDAKDSSSEQYKKAPNTSVSRTRPAP